MQECDSLSFCSDAGRLVDQSDSSGTTLRERLIEVIDGEADVVDPGSPPRDEAADRGILIHCLEELDEGPPSVEPRDVRSVHVSKPYRLHLENFTTERSEIFQRSDSDSDVRDSRALGGSRRH